jgi:hypothetical protein
VFLLHMQNVYSFKSPPARVICNCRARTAQHDKDLTSDFGHSQSGDGRVAREIR